MQIEKKPRPGLLWSILTMRCPRCRTGNMFTHKNPYKKFRLSYILDMPYRCPVCNQKYDLEVGFWYGTGYVSYALTVLFSGITFIAWWILIGVSVDDNRIFYWLIFNGVLMVLLQPWLMRLSRAVYLYFFVKYDPDYEVNKTAEFDY